MLKVHMVTIEDLVPTNHFLRKLEDELDLSFVYEESATLYSRKYGRPPINPEVVVKYLLVGFLYGIPSERQIEQRIQTDVALRWYLGLDLFDRVPDHSTISQLRHRKPTFRKIFRRLFEEVVHQCIDKGLVSGRIVATDSTHVKANAWMIWASPFLSALKPVPMKGLTQEARDVFHNFPNYKLSQSDAARLSCLEAGKSTRKRRQSKEFLENVAKLKDPTKRVTADPEVFLFEYHAMVFNIQRQIRSYHDPYSVENISSLSQPDIDKLQSLTDSCCEMTQDFVRQVREGKWQQHD